MDLRIIAASAGAVLVLAGTCRAQAPDPGNATGVPQRELVVGTKEAPPFAMKAADGSWSGISIDLWRRIADRLHLRYRFSEQPTVQALVAGTAEGSFDAAIAALTVTAARILLLHGQWRPDGTALRRLEAQLQDHQRQSVHRHA